MGFVEILYKDHSGIRLEGGKMVEMAWDYCGVCREIKSSEQGESGELGTFMCYTCLGWKHESA